jgi:hypothetical protein
MLDNPFCLHLLIGFYGKVYLTLHTHIILLSAENRDMNRDMNTKDEQGATCYETYGTAVGKNTKWKECKWKWMMWWMTRCGHVLILCMWNMLCGALYCGDHAAFFKCWKGLAYESM